MSSMLTALQLLELLHLIRVTTAELLSPGTVSNVNTWLSYWWLH